MILSKKQIELYNDIVSENVPRISVLGSTQSGKTYDICHALIQYAKNLNNYEKKQRENPNYIPRKYYGAIIGWDTKTIENNIVDNIRAVLNEEYHFTKGKEYELKYSIGEHYLEIYGVKFFFFAFNNKLSFNTILGRALIFVWIDEAARIYSQGNLRDSFDQIPGRQMSYIGHPYYKRIDSFNVEGGRNHPYKTNYIDNIESKKYVFFPWDNPILNTKEKMIELKKTFPNETLVQQKIFNKWIVAEGNVFNKINEVPNLNDYMIREIGIGIDYGSVNPTTFVPIALATDTKTGKWHLIRLQTYFHDPKKEMDTPTTEYYSNQLRLFIRYLKKEYVNIPITELVIDSEAAHFSNRLVMDQVRHEKARKGAGSVDNGVQYLQSLFHKNYLYIYKTPSIREMLPNGEPVYDYVDQSYLEFENYRYDRDASERSGVNCYVKEQDHSIDATRYILELFKETNRSPVV